MAQGFCVDFLKRLSFDLFEWHNDMLGLWKSLLTN